MAILATDPSTCWPQTGLTYLGHLFQEHRLAPEPPGLRPPQRGQMKTCPAEKLGQRIVTQKSSGLQCSLTGTPWATRSPLKGGVEVARSPEHAWGFGRRKALERACLTHFL